MSAPSSPITSMLIWNGIKIMIKHEPNRCGDFDHIELQSENLVPLPLTRTGYFSHFCYETQIEPYGSALAFMQAWMDHEAMKPEWRAFEQASKQLSLF